MRLASATAAYCVALVASVGVVGTAACTKQPSEATAAHDTSPPPKWDPYGSSAQGSVANSPTGGSDEEAAIRKAIAERPCAPAFTIDSFRITDRDPDPQVPDGEQVEARIEISRTANFDPVLNSAGCTFTLLGSMAGLRALQEAPSATVMLLAKIQKREAEWRVNELALATE